MRSKEKHKRKKKTAFSNIQIHFFRQAKHTRTHRWQQMIAKNFCPTSILHYITPWDFFTPALADGLSDSKSPQVSWILLGILADLNEIVVWMISSSPLIWSLPFPLPSFWELFQIHQLQLVSPFHSCFIDFLVRRYDKVHCPAVSLFSFLFLFFFFFWWLSIGLVVWPRLGGLLRHKTQRSLCILFSKTDSG